MSSTPAAPLFAFTLLKALFRLSLSSIFSKSSGCALSRSFHIRRNDLRAPAYLSCSALFFCGQPSFSRFSAIAAVPPFPVVLGTPTDSALHLSATMASADFCTFSTPLRAWLPLSERSVQTSPGTTRFFPSIHLPHLPPPVPCSYWTSTCVAVLSLAIALYAVSVRQARGLPAPSFRFHLAMDTLGVRLYPSRYRADSGLSPVRNVRRRAHFT